jgi:hypothetical protein
MGMKREDLDGLPLAVLERIKKTSSDMGRRWADIGRAERKAAETPPPVKAQEQPEKEAEFDPYDKKAIAAEAEAAADRRWAAHEAQQQSQARKNATYGEADAYFATLDSEDLGPEKLDATRDADAIDNRLALIAAAEEMVAGAAKAGHKVSITLALQILTPAKFPNAKTKTVAAKTTEQKPTPAAKATAGKTASWAGKVLHMPTGREAIAQIKSPREAAIEAANERIKEMGIDPGRVGR